MREEQVVVDDQHADAFSLRLGLPGEARVKVVAAVAQALVGFDRAQIPHAVAHDHWQLKPIARLGRARPGIDGAQFVALIGREEGGCADRSSVLA